MKAVDLIQSFYQWRERFGRAFDIVDIQMMFPAESRGTLLRSLNRLTASNDIVRVARGVYCLPGDANYRYLLEHAASKLRRGEVCYISQESLLSEVGVISQQMLDQIIIMTTGRTGVFNTCRGTIHMRHTRRSISELNALCEYSPERRIWVPPVWLAYEDLKHARRNLDLVDMHELEELLHEQSNQQH